MKLEDLEIYQIAIAIGEKVWSIVIRWDEFTKSTIGKQYVEAADSIAANISESYGRFHYGESRQFMYYSRGSLSETKTWTQKAFLRKLITNSENEELEILLNRLSVKLNNYIKTIGRNVVGEDEIQYGSMN